MSLSEEADRQRDKRRKEDFRKQVIDDSMHQRDKLSKHTRSLSNLSIPSISPPNTTYHGSWTSVKSPVHVPQDAAVHGTLLSGFPQLPKHSLSGSEHDEKLLLIRYRSGQNLISALNVPNQSDWFSSGFKSLLEGSDLSTEILKPAPAPYHVSLTRIQSYMDQNAALIYRWGLRNHVKFDPGRNPDVYWSSMRNRLGRVLERKRTKSALEEEIKKCFDVVPKNYFDPNFKASDPVFFQEISEAKNSFVLQEKLSNYLDVVEVTILNHISQLTESFFMAMYTIQV